jgi:hypothetical protein
MALAPLVIVAFWPWAGGGTATVESPEQPSARSFLGYLIIATAASQVVIAGGPIAVGFIGGTATAVSIVFATFTLFRGPITSAYNLVARVLPDFTDLSLRGDDAALDVWRHRIAAAGLVLATATSFVAYFIGPGIIAALYGDAFAPSATVAALAGAGVGAGLGALFVAQIYIASARTRRLAAGWVLALIIAGFAIAISNTDVITKVAVGFAAGESAAMIILGFAPRART